VRETVGRMETTPGRATKHRGVLCAAGLAVLLGTSILAAQDDAPVRASYTINPQRVLNRIDEKVYGHFFEHIYHSANGGLWGELVWNRSFEENSSGLWRIEDGQIVQAGMGTDQRLIFGDPTWTDYEYTLEARKTGGGEGFLILFRIAAANEFYWYNIGGWGNVRHQLEKASGSARGTVGPQVTDRIETGKWYRIRVRCEGNHLQIWLDDKQVLDYTDERSPHLSGRVGVGTWATTAKFRNIKVAALDGTVLFKGLPPAPERVFAARHWSMFGPGEASVETGNAFNSNACVRIVAEAGETGLTQDELCIRPGETYEGSLWARGSARRLLVRLISGEKVIAEQRLKAPRSDWRELKFKLRSKVSDPNAILQVAVRGKADVAIDQVSMMPRSWKGKGGFRSDLLDAMAGLQPPVIRWPGGCFASPYRWKDGIGPQHRRRVTRMELWDDLDINSLGTDEFVALCRLLGTEPLLVVNIGTPQWNADAGSSDFMQDVLDWIEYCNGPADSKWGKVRAANGHPEPYDVKYWEIDNETWGMGVDDYIAAVNRFAPAMCKADPSIKLAACGSGGFDLEWNRRMIDGCGQVIDYLSIHHYEDPGRFAEGPGNYERFIRQTGEVIAKSANPKVKIYCSEWNAQSTDWRTGLYAGGVLNAFERCGDVFEIGGPALFLRHVSATAWDNAFINFDQSSWFPAPNYVVMRLWSNHYAPNRVEVTGDVDKLNIVATKSRNGRILHVKCVNPVPAAVDVSLRLADGAKPAAAVLHVVAPGSLDARNTLANPDGVRAERADMRLDGETIRFVLPGLSAGAAAIEL